MIKKSSLWRGAIGEAYRKEIDLWCEQNTEPETITEFIDLGDISSKEVFDSEFENIGLGDNFALFDPEKCVIIYNTNEWSAPDVKKLVGQLQKIDSEYVVAFTQTKDAAGIKALTDVVDEDFDFIIPKEYPEMGKWLVDSLARAEVEVSLKDATRLAEHCGDSRDMAISVSKTLVAANRGRSVSWEDNIAPILDRMGFVAPYKLTGAIAKGSIEESLITLSRLSGGGMAPLGIVGMLRKRYFSYAESLGFKNHNDFAKHIGGSPYAAKFIFQEARTLGQNRIARSIAKIAETDAGLKGGMTGIHNEAVLEMMVVELANQFRLSSKR